MDTDDLNIVVDAFVVAGMAMMYLFNRRRSSAATSKTVQSPFFLPGKRRSPYLSDDAPREDTSPPPHS